MEYTLPTALADVVQYHNTCSFMYGLNKALQEGIQDTTEADIAKLTRRLTMVSLQIGQKNMEISQPGLDEEDKESLKSERKKLTERYDAISDALKELELRIQGEGATGEAPMENADTPTTK